METLTLINFIFQHDNIKTVEFASTKVSSEDNRMAPIKAIEQLSAYHDCPDMFWGWHIIGEDLVIFAKSN